MFVWQRRLMLVAAAFASVCVSACATGSVARRTRAISDADAQAKRAIENEGTINTGRIPAASLGVVPFSTPNDTLLRPLSFALTDLLVGDLATSPKLMLVDRHHMDAMLREFALVDSGAVDPRTAPRVGKLLGARRLLIGNLSTDGQGELVVQTRVVDAIAGTVAEVVTARAPLARILDATDALALRVFEELGIVLTPAQRLRVDASSNTPVATLLAYGRGLEAEARRDTVGADAFFAQATRLDSRFVAERRQASSTQPGSTSSGVQRALALGVQGINSLGPVRVADAAEAQLSTGNLFTFVVTIHILP